MENNTTMKEKHIKNYRRAEKAINKYFNAQLNNVLKLSGEGANARHVRKRWQTWLDALNAADNAPKMTHIEFRVEKKTRATARLYINHEFVAVGHGGGSMCGGFNFLDAACAQAVKEYGIHHPILMRFCIENWKAAANSWGFFQDSYILPMFYPSSGMSGFCGLFYRLKKWDYNSEYSKTFEVIKAWRS